MTITNVGRTMTLPISEVAKHFTNYDVKTPLGFRHVADEQAIVYAGLLRVITTASGKQLRVTPDHISILVLADGKHEPYKSSELQVGDTVFTEENVSEVIKSIEDKEYKGLVHDLTIEPVAPKFDPKDFADADPNEKVSLVSFDDGHEEFMTKVQIEKLKP